MSSIAAFDSTYSIAVGTSKGLIKVLKIERMSAMNEVSKISKVESNP